MVKRKLRRNLFAKLYGDKIRNTVFWVREDGSLHPNLPSVLTMLNTTPHALSNLFGNVFRYEYSDPPIECLGNFLSRHPEVVKPYNKQQRFML